MRFSISDLREPIDLTGVPRTNGEELVEFKPLLWTKVLTENPGILLLDDYLDVQRPDLFSAGYKITLERRAGYHRLHDGVMVVCASNTPEESSLSQMIPCPLANRMTLLYVDRPTVNEWANWMNQNHGDDWDRRTLGFLKKFEQEGEGFLLRMPRETEVLRNFPTPRTWTRASLELERTNDPEVLDGLLGPEVGQKFHAFTQVDVDVDQLLKEPELWDRQTIDAKYMLCLELASWFAGTEEAGNGFDLLDRMMEESRQFPILVFMSMSVADLSDLLNVVIKNRPNYHDIVEQAIEDRSAISK